MLPVTVPVVKLLLILPVETPASPPVWKRPDTLPLTSPTLRISEAPLVWPKSPTRSVPDRLMVRPVMVWPRPSKLPLKLVEVSPTGWKP